MAIYEVQVTETNTGYVFVEADSPAEAAVVAEGRMTDVDWESLVYWDGVGLEVAEGVERAADEIGTQQVLRDDRDVWVEPIGQGVGLFGPYADEVEASEAMDDLGLDDAGHRVVVREG